MLNSLETYRNSTFTAFRRYIMQRLLITGGAGFIGSNFTRLWLRDHPNDRVIILDSLTYAGNFENLSSISQHPGFSFIKGDIRDSSLVDRILMEEDINTIVHFAAESRVERTTIAPQIFTETNIIGTFSLLETVRKCWTKTLEEKRFIQVSTGSVYGTLSPEDFPSDENSPRKPTNIYSASKIAGDYLAYSYYQAYDIPIIITNCSDNYGPFQIPEKLIPITIINAIERKPISIYGNGKNVRDWIYVEDHYRALRKILQDGVLGETYNIGGNCEKRDIDVIRMICDKVDEFTGLKGIKSSHNLISFVDDRPVHNSRYSLNTSKIRWKLGWIPMENFETGLYKTVNWYFRNQGWWQRVRSGAYRKYYQEQYKKRLEGQDN